MELEQNTWKQILVVHNTAYKYVRVYVFCVYGNDSHVIVQEWRKLHIEELNELYSSPTIVRLIKSRSMRWAGHVARMGEGTGVCRVLVGKPEGRRPLGRPRRRWEDNIKVDLKDVGWGHGLDRAGSG
jgi:hypothetical protein